MNTVFIEHANQVGRFTLRPMQPDDVRALRAIRLEGLEAEAKVFAANRAEEMLIPINEWRDACRETKDRCWIGAFAGDVLAGITLAMKWEQDVSGKTALFRSSYVRPEYRGEGLAGELCEARLAWARRHGYEAAMLFYRQGHWIEKVVRDFGAVYSHTEEMSFSNGDVAPTLWFRKTI